MGYNKFKILIVEDDRIISTSLQTILEAGGYRVISAERCMQGLMLFSSHQPDLVILDLGLPDEDGEYFLQQVRLESNTPILILSSRSDEQDKVSALDLGANDYITKPFGTGELLARVRASLRIARHHVQATAHNGLFVLEDMIIDYDRRNISVAGEDIHLTQTEYNILAFLSQHVGKVMTYSSIIGAIWGVMDSGSIKKLQVNMANIRKKLGCKPGENRYIINELGVGYRMPGKNE